MVKQVFSVFCLIPKMCVGSYDLLRVTYELFLLYSSSCVHTYRFIPSTKPLLSCFRISQTYQDSINSNPYMDENDVWVGVAFLALLKLLVIAKPHLDPISPSRYDLIAWSLYFSILFIILHSNCVLYFWLYLDDSGL